MLLNVTNMVLSRVVPRAFGQLCCVTKKVLLSLCALKREHDVFLKK